MKNCRIPDSQEKHNLVQYLQEKIEECKEGIYASSGSQEISREEEEWWTKLSIYREVLEMIR